MDRGVRIFLSTGSQKEKEAAINLFYNAIKIKLTLKIEALDDSEGNGSLVDANMYFSFFFFFF